MHHYIVRTAHALVKYHLVLTPTNHCLRVKDRFCSTFREI